LAVADLLVKTGWLESHYLVHPYHSVPVESL